MTTAAFGEIPIGLSSLGLTATQAREWMSCHEAVVRQRGPGPGALLRTWEMFRSRYKPVEKGDHAKGWEPCADSRGCAPAVEEAPIDFRGILGKLAQLPERAFASKGVPPGRDWREAVAAIARKTPLQVEAVAGVGWMSGNSTPSRLPLLPPALVVGTTLVLGPTEHQHRFVYDPDTGLGMTDEAGSGGDPRSCAHEIYRDDVTNQIIIAPAGIDGHTHSLPSGDSPQLDVIQGPREPLAGGSVIERLGGVAEALYKIKPAPKGKS